MKLALTLALLALTGCASTRDFVERHPTITLIAFTSVAVTAVAMSGGHSGPSPTPDYTVQPVNCAAGGCK